MGTKYKMTGCARMAIFLIILLPIAYFGAKYLQNSGTWDKVQDKIENKEDISSPERTTERPQSQRADDKDGLRKQNEEQEELIRRQQERIRELEEKSRTGSTSTTSAPRETHNQPRETTNNQSNSGPSIEELLQESDNNLGTGPGPDTSTRTSGAKLLGKWSFTYSGTSGNIELLEQNSKLLSRITQPNRNGNVIDELEIRGDRYYVKGSPTGEYYMLNSNGDLDAYDQDGFQTTCRRSR